MSRFQLRNLGRYVLALVFVAVATGVAEVLYRLTASTRLSMVFLGGVLVSAFILGAGPAYFAACVAFLIYNFYLVEPRFSISIGTPEDLITLVVFFAVAMLTGNLTGRVRDEARRAEARANATAALFRATRDFAASAEEDFIRQRLAEHLATAAKAPALVQLGDAVFTSPEGIAAPQAVRDEATVVGRLASRTPISTLAVQGWRLRPLHTDGLTLGVAGWQAPLTPDPKRASDEALLEILVDAGAAAIARARLAAAKAGAEARARTETLRNALLSSVSHDLRTPLAAIMASASSLETFGEAFAPAVRTDLAATIREEAERLDSFVGNLLSMTKLESGALTVQRVPFSVDEVIDRTAQRHRLAHRRDVLVTPGTDLQASGDPVLFEQALANVVENALRYSPPEGPVRISAEPSGDRAIVRVSDQGSGVAQKDIERIFEKFYRAPGVSAAGTGLGLSITRGLIESMGGVVTATNLSRPGQGFEVTLNLALAR